jgi:hypothetical protein
MRGLLMDWIRLPGGEGFTSRGRENAYLATADLTAGRVTGVRLTRWRVQPVPLLITLEASRNVITFPLLIPRSPGDRTVADLLETAKLLADRYETGEYTWFAGHPAWQRPRRPDGNTT